MIVPPSLPQLYVIREDDRGAEITNATGAPIHFAPNISELERLYKTYIKGVSTIGSEYVSQEEYLERVHYTNGSTGLQAAPMKNKALASFTRAMKSQKKLANVGKGAGTKIVQTKEAMIKYLEATELSEILDAAKADAASLSSAAATVSSSAKSLVGWGSSSTSSGPERTTTSNGVFPQSRVTLQSARTNKNMHERNRTARALVQLMRSPGPSTTTSISSSSSLIPQAQGRVAVVSSSRVISDTEKQLLTALREAIGNTRSSDEITYNSLVAEAQRHAANPTGAYIFSFSNLLKEIGLEEFTKIEEAFDALEAYYTSNPPRGGARKNKTQKRKQSRKSCWPKSRKQNKNQNRKNKTRKH